ncbi:MAG: hypothetical protein J6X58_03080 [Bacteroidales bacterium]|nr:hypothetical protein [Bacteroidales bacterium]
MNPELKKTYDRRYENAQQRLKFKEKPEIVESVSFANIACMNDRYGVITNDRIVVMPVFDEIKLSDDGVIAYCRLGDLWTLYSTIDGEEILPQSIPSLPIYDSAHQTLEIVADEHHHGLYDINSHKLVLEAEYDDVDCCTAYRYLWIKENNEWGFIEKNSKTKRTIPNTAMAYEAEHGLFIRMKEQNIIICINEDGISDPMALRKYVLANGGRGTAYNAKYHETVHFDIYGNILK